MQTNNKMPKANNNDFNEKIVISGALVWQDSDLETEEGLVGLVEVISKGNIDYFQQNVHTHIFRPLCRRHRGICQKRLERTKAGTIEIKDRILVEDYQICIEESNYKRISMMLNDGMMLLEKEKVLGYER